MSDEEVKGGVPSSAPRRRVFRGGSGQFTVTDSGKGVGEPIPADAQLAVEAARIALDNGKGK